MPKRVAEDGAGFARQATSVDELLAEARASLDRLSPDDARASCWNGAILIDIRSDSERSADGPIPGAHVVPRNVVEWRLDPASPDRDERLARTDRKVILVCNEGYQSSLVAATLRRFGLYATDVVGGFRAW